MARFFRALAVTSMSSVYLMTVTCGFKDVLSVNTTNGFSIIPNVSDLGILRSLGALGIPGL